MQSDAQVVVSLGVRWRHAHGAAVCCQCLRPSACLLQCDAELAQQLARGHQPSGHLEAESRRLRPAGSLQRVACDERGVRTARRQRCRVLKDVSLAGQLCQPCVGGLQRWVQDEQTTQLVDSGVRVTGVHQPVNGVEHGLCPAF